MQANVGTIDRIIRVVLGLLLIAYALKIGFPETGWNWVGWIGVILILTAAVSFCPLYSFLKCSTRSSQGG
jgi:hypothetical protein